jgi:chloramphenicol 3-O-phosphotransferase
VSAKRKLVVIYGPPLSGKSTLAWALGRSFDDKTAVVSSDQLLGGAIAVADADAATELDMAHIQLRLLVANYLKNGYNVVVEGPFLFERAGMLYSYEADIDQLIALMRHLTEEALIVRLTASEEALRQRSADQGREQDITSALRIANAFKPRYGGRFLEFDASAKTIDEIAASIRGRLERDD